MVTEYLEELASANTEKAKTSVESLVEIDEGKVICMYNAIKCLL